MCTPITLPALQLVCTLVAVGTSGNGSDSAEQRSLLENQTLPAGYKLYHDVATYKFYNYEVTWIEAKMRCAQDGAQLAVIDSSQKFEYIKRQIHSVNEEFLYGYGQEPLFRGIHAGIIRMDSEWVNVNTGLRVSSIPWGSDHTALQSRYDCVVMSRHFSGEPELRQLSCSGEFSFICELPIYNSSIIIN